MLKVMVPHKYETPTWCRFVNLVDKNGGDNLNEQLETEKMEHARAPNE